jgi:hypothetical protein
LKIGRLTLVALLAVALPASLSAGSPRAPVVRGEAQAATFIDRLYAYYRVEPARPRDDSAVWSPAMLALMSRLDGLDDEARLEVSDGDEICQCQDWGDFRLLARRIVLHGPRRADAFVRFRNLGRVTAMRLVLERTATGWRVADIYASDRPGGLAAAYRKALATRPNP